MATNELDPDQLRLNSLLNTKVSNLSLQYFIDHLHGDRLVLKSSRSKMAENTVFELAYKGNFEGLKLKIADDDKILTLLDDNGRMLIHWAALGGHKNIVKYLLDRSGPVDPRDDTEMTPLILASSAGREQVVHLLIACGANVNSKNEGGHSSLQYAASKGWKNIVDMLLANHADINIADKIGATALHRAASKGNTEIVKLLLGNGNQLKINAPDNYGNTALHLACEENREEEARLLVSHGARLDIKNKEGLTALDLASQALNRQLLALSES